MPRKTHEENLATVCCVCGRKGNKYRNVTDDLALKVQLIHPSYDRSGGIHPTAICSTCRNALSELEKDPEQTRRRIPGKLDYSTIRGPGVSTRAKTDAGCSCSICSIGGLGVNDEKAHNKEISNPLGRPAGEVEKMETDDATANLNISIKTCEYCRAEIRQGVKHVCNQTERRRNMAELLKTSSQGTLETVLGEGLKEALRRDEELASSDSTHGKDQLSLKSRFGGASPLTVTVGKGRTREFRQLTIQDFLQVKKSLGLSCVQTKKLAFHIRAGTRNRKAVESGLAEALAESNILLDDLFTAEEVLVENKEGEGEEKTLVYCNDISELVLRLLEYRELDPSTTDAKLGLDKGQGSVKVTLSLMERDERVKTGRQTYAEGVGVRQHTSGSTYKVVVLALLYDAPETYETVRMMMQKLQLENFPATITSDIKMLLLLIGKSGGNLTYGCVFCSAAKPLTQAGELYCLSDLQKLHLDFQEAGADKKKQKDFQNVVNKPLLELEPDDLVLGTVAPPELHLMLGVTDKLKKSLEKTVFETEDEGKAFIDTFLDEENISKKGYMDSRSLEGNQTRRFLKSTEKLRDAYEQVGKLARAEPIIRLLELFSELVSKCFGPKLVSGYEDAVKEFSSAYLKLNQQEPGTFAVTPKIHIVMFHVVQYLQLLNAETQEDRGLGYVSEQAFEAVHSDMRKRWERGWKVSPTNKEFRAKLRKFVVAYNSNNV